MARGKRHRVGPRLVSTLSVLTPGSWQQAFGCRNTGVNTRCVDTRLAPTQCVCVDAGLASTRSVLT
eukprot:11448267-Alexandrium_andersonii.AAC.1